MVRNRNTSRVLVVGSSSLINNTEPVILVDTESTISDDSLLDKINKELLNVKPLPTNYHSGKELRRQRRAKLRKSKR